MGFSDEDRILMENLYVFKGYGTKKTKEFLNKGWRPWGLNQKAATNWLERQDEAAS